MKSHRSVLALLALVAQMSWQAQAQQVLMYDPYTPEPLPIGAPAWLSAIAENPSGVNYARMDSLFNLWLAADVDARVKTTDRKPAVNFYRRWARAYRPYVQRDGSIALPTMQEHLQKLDAQNALAATAQYSPSMSGHVQKRWRNIGPNATYENKGTSLTDKDSQVCVYRIAVAPTDHQVVYCGTETGVVFKTTDRGLTWQACNGTHNFGGSIYAIQVSPQTPDIVYVGGGQHLWKSADGGRTWQREPDVVGRVNSIRIAPDNPRHITVCSGMANDADGGFYVSQDGGHQYTRTLAGICHDHELQPGNALRQYLLIKPQGATNFELRVTVDGGQTFNSVSLPVNNIVAGRLAVSEAPGGGNYVYALVNSSPYGLTQGPYGGLGLPHLLKSVDAGSTWTDQTVRDAAKPWTNTFSPVIDDKSGGQGYFDMTLGVSNKDPEHVIYGLCSAYRSTQGGKGDYRTNAIGGYQRLDYMHPDIQDIAVAGNDTWVTTDGGIKYSADFFATKGENRHAGVYASDYHGFGQAWNEDVMAGGRWHNGDAVHAAAYGEGNTLVVGGVEYPTGHVMMSDPYKIYFSDAGVRLMPQQMAGNIKEIYGQYFTEKQPYETLRTSGELAFDPRYAKRLMIHSREDIGQLYLSEDEGQSFRLILDTEGEMICSYAFSRSNPDHLYVSGMYNIYHSVNGGGSWEILPTRAFEMTYSGMVSSSLAVHPRDEQTLWFVYSNEAGGVAYTTDAGATWHYPLPEALKKHTFQWVVLTGDDLNGVYLGTADGATVFYKDDTMTDWVDYSSGLNPGARLTRLVPFYKEGKLRAATSQGIWEIPLYRENFVPVAQPMATNIGHGDLTHSPDFEVRLDSYSIVNQKDVQWEWSFQPQPTFVSDSRVRNPRVRFGRNGEYDVTLKVTTPQGSHSRTMKKMIRIGNATSVSSAKNVTPSVTTLAASLKVGEPLVLEMQGLAAEKRLTLHNAKGALLRHLTLSPQDNRAEVPTNGLTAGVYLYEVRTAKHKFFGKFVIH